MIIICIRSFCIWITVILWRLWILINWYNGGTERARLINFGFDEDCTNMQRRRKEASLIPQKNAKQFKRRFLVVGDLRTDNWQMVRIIRSQRK